MEVITDEEFDQLEKERRHLEFISVLKQSAASRDLSLIEPVLKKLLGVLTDLAAKTSAVPPRPDNKQIELLSAQVGELKNILKCVTRDAVFTVIRDKDGLIKEVIRTNEKVK